ncbi:MAG TPA: NADH:flavin oxidoreductase [Nitrospirota bacterium]|nr:NADH:flavin oxidoreductase [Nitrospirota bacterium]
MNTLFDTTKINAMELRNRFVRSATWEGMCDEDGRPGSRLAGCYQDLARGGVGLIITGYAYVLRDGKQTRGSLGAHRDDFEKEMKMLSAAVHREGGKLCMQLVHTGGQARVASDGKLIAPSAVAAEEYSGMPVEMTQQDIENVVRSFAASAKRAKAWGFDAVQIHAAHGYLISQFLSPRTNLRADEYGGSIENRARFLLAVYRRVRTEVGKTFPVLLKLNGSDHAEKGLTPDDAVLVAAALDRAGIDAIEVSSGTPASGDLLPARKTIDTREKEAYNLELAVQIKRAVACPVMVVGGFRSFDIAERALQSAGADYISLARPFIREPDLVKRWQGGDVSRARCISCNGCYRPGMREGGIACIVERAEQKRKSGA